MAEQRTLTIFVHRASECLTDHRSHGDGLICHSLLAGLARRGHKIYAFTNDDQVGNKVENLIVRGQAPRSPAHALANWELAWRANRWLKRIARHERIDLVWRMHPYGMGCPAVPAHGDRPLVVGPLFYAWPVASSAEALGRPRLGFGIAPLLRPLAERGWARTLKQASLVICATPAHAQATSALTGGQVVSIPVMVQPPVGLEDKPADPEQALRLLFVGNLEPKKNAQVFVETVALLERQNIAVQGAIVGEGSEDRALRDLAARLGVSIQFLGRLPNNEIYGVMAQFDMLLSASVSEPYGRSIVEAMSVGTPALCHRSGGPADIIDDGADGLLSSVLSAEAYAKLLAPPRSRSTAPRTFVTLGTAEISRLAKRHGAR